MSPLAALLLAAALSEGTVLVDLGLDVREGDGNVVIVSVVENSRAWAAGLREGQRIVAVGARAISTIDQLIDAIRARGPGAPLDIEVEQHEAYEFGFRGGAIGNLLTGDKGTYSAWLGFFAHLGLAKELRVLLGFGYTAIGDEPFVGRDAFTPVLGVEGDLSIFGDTIVPFARVLVSWNITWHDGVATGPFFAFRQWEQETFGLTGQAGVRFGFIDLGLSAGLGPAEGFNMGLVFTAWIPL